MATSLGYGTRQYEWKIPFRAPPPTTYNADNAHEIAYPHLETWKIGRPGTFHETSKTGVKMTQQQREAVRLTKYTDIPIDMKEKTKKYRGDLSARSRDDEEERVQGVKYMKMYPYHERDTKYEEHTKSSKAKIFTRMEYDYKNEGKKYYKYKFPDYVVGPGKYYDYNKHHKHFFKVAKGTKIEKTTKERLEVRMKFSPAPDNYKPLLTVTNEKPRIYSFGYKETLDNRTTAPGPGQYKVRTSLKGQVPDNKVQKARVKRSKKSKKKKKKKRLNSSRKNAQSSQGQYSTQAESEQQMRKTMFSTFGSAAKNGFYKFTCSPGPGRYNVTYKKRSKDRRMRSMTDRARTVKSTFGTDIRNTEKRTRIINPTGPGHYPALEKNENEKWILRHSAKFLGREKGWEKVKHNGVPAPGRYNNRYFNLKSKVGFLQGKGIRSDITDGLEGHLEGPGPNHDYEIVNCTQMGVNDYKKGKKMINMHLGGKGPRSKAVTSTVPGAGTYAPKTSLTKPKSTSNSMAGRNKIRKYKNGQKFPSPVSYDPIVSFKKLKEKFGGTFVKAGVGFPKSHRTKYKKSPFIGPGNHKVRKKLGGSKYSFGNSQRFPCIDEDDVQPGPGKYNAPSFTCTAPAYLFKKPMEDQDIIYDL